MLYKKLGISQESFNKVINCLDELGVEYELEGACTIEHEGEAFNVLDVTVQRAPVDIFSTLQYSLNVKLASLNCQDIDNITVMLHFKD